VTQTPSTSTAAGPAPAEGAGLPANTALPEIERTVSEIGAKVAAARAEHGWSLAQLGRRAGLSTAAVHKIEKSGMTPTIASLMKIAAALGTTVSYLIDEADADHEVTVTRRDEREPISSSKPGIELRDISGRYGPFTIAGAEAVVAPRADSGLVPMRHVGEELVVVLDGAMTFTIAGQAHHLQAGDSIHFRTHHPHSWSNPEDRPSRLMWFVGRS
jgi:transcriptional regulator with XRE-family HTH domain